MKHLRLLPILLLLGALCFNQAVYTQELSTVKVSELTDVQVKQLSTEISKRGLSMEEAASLARMRGASEIQVQEMIRRMLEMDRTMGDTTATVSKETNRKKSTEEKSVFSKKSVVAADSIEQTIFGFALFNNKNLTFEPSINIQTPKEYIMGVGDELIINVWGASEAVYKSTVDKNGSIQIPQIGPIFINGLSYEAAESLIRKRLISIHNGLAGSHPNTFSSVTLVGLKSIHLSIVGEVMAPGNYTLPATATLFNAMYLSGGPNKNGSFRKVQLIRNGKIHKNIDIYNFLVNADPRDNISLQDQDIIFIPTYEKRVSVGGEFLRTGLFEMKDQETLSNLIHFTGGFTNKAFRFRVTVNRNTPTERKVQDIEAADFGSFIMENGDSITAGTILDRYANRVKIGGAVFRPGTFELVNGMTLLDLIKKAEGLKEEAYLNRGQILRLNEDNDTLSVAFDVAEVMAGKQNIELMREDSVTIKSVRDMREEYFVKIYGEVINPGIKSWYDKLTLQDLLFEAGGFKESADIRVIEVARRLNFGEAANLSDSLVHVYSVGVSRDLKATPEYPAFELQPYDRILVRRAPGFRDQGNAAITGEVLYAGYYSIKSKKDRITDLIKWSGGLTPDAYLDAATLFKKDSVLVAIDLVNILKAPGTLKDMILEPYDSLNIPKRPQIVDIKGQVQKPFATTFIPGKTVKYYIKNAGGWADSPAKGAVYVTYPDGSSDNTRTFIVHHYPKVKPGSMIMVPHAPEKTPRPDRTALWLAVASTMSSIALTLVTILNLTK